MRKMRKLPYIEPAIRTIAGALITASGIIFYLRPDLHLLGLALLFFVSVNLLQSGFTRFCLMEKILRKCRFRSEMDEIRSLNKINAEHLDTLNLLSEVVVELSWDGRIVRLTDSWSKLLGKEAVNVLSCPCLGRPFAEYVHADDRAALRQLLERIEDGEVRTLRLRMLREDDDEHWVEGKFTRYGKHHPRSVIRGVLRDITESYLQEKHISHMAMHDALTNLPNRVLLEERMEQAITQAKRRGHKVAVLFIDLDNFKQVNDVHGHKAGDHLLVSISTVLKETLRDSDTMARWGGDEFVVLLQGLQDESEASEVAEKLMSAIQQRVLVEYIDTKVTLSIGVAVFPDDASASDKLLIKADKALFFAKSQGRNNVQIYGRMRDGDRGHEDLDRTGRFAAAVSRREIQVNYQPLVEAASGRTVAFEALARWHDEKQGWVSPAIFIPLAENLGMIGDMGRQVLEQALQDFSEFARRDSGLQMSVNISNRQLFLPGFKQELLALVEKYGVAPKQLKLEITESIALLGMGNIKASLKELADAGFCLSLDDFGTGYSSLSYLHEFPVCELKIDISFVRRIHSDSGRIMIKTIVDMGRALKLRLVAEGVEDAETARLLQEMGVERLQGYYFSKPLPREDCMQLIGKQLSPAPLRPAPAPAAQTACSSLLQADGR
ncbi:MAG TPA: EAL domain-containing protein [Gallionellaceae bacterium]